MFKRLILILIASLSLSTPDTATASAGSDFRATANGYLTSAANYALAAYSSGGKPGSLAPLLTYLYSLQAKYSGEISALLDQAGNTTLRDLYNRISSTLSASALAQASKTFIESTPANLVNAYNTYIAAYLGNLYSTYATFFK